MTVCLVKPSKEVNELMRQSMMDLWTNDVGINFSISCGSREWRINSFVLAAQSALVRNAIEQGNHHVDCFYEACSNSLCGNTNIKHILRLGVLMQIMDKIEAFDNLYRYGLIENGTGDSAIRDIREL